jgi:hypothetical protein
MAGIDQSKLVDLVRGPVEIQPEVLYTERQASWCGIKSIATNPNGEFYVGHENGLITRHPPSGEWVVMTRVIYPTSMVYAKGHLYVLNSPSGYYQHRKQSLWRMKTTGLTKQTKLTEVHDSVCSLMYDEDDTLYMTGGILKKHPNMYPVGHYRMSSGKIDSVVHDLGIRTIDLTTTTNTMGDLLVTVRLMHSRMMMIVCNLTTTLVHAIPGPVMDKSEVQHVVDGMGQHVMVYQSENRINFDVGGIQKHYIQIEPSHRGGRLKARLERSTGSVLVAISQGSYDSENIATIYRVDLGLTSWYGWDPRYHLLHSLVVRAYVEHLMFCVHRINCGKTSIKGLPWLPLEMWWAILNMVTPTHMITRRKRRGIVPT